MVQVNKKSATNCKICRPCNLSFEWMSCIPTKSHRTDGPAKAPRPQSEGINKVYRIIFRVSVKICPKSGFSDTIDIRIQINISTPKPQRILAYEPPHRRVIIALEVVVETGFSVIVLAGQANVVGDDRNTNLGLTERI